MIINATFSLYLTVGDKRERQSDVCVCAQADEV